MSNARLWLALVGETMSIPRAPFLSRAWGSFRFSTPLSAHEPEADS